MLVLVDAGDSFFGLFLFFSLLLRRRQLRTHRKGTPRKEKMDGFILILFSFFSKEEEEEGGIIRRVYRKTCLLTM